ncbi:MAG: thioredoxin [Myxococcota bacterium]
MAHEHILDATEENFGVILRSRKPVVVDFWAAWCGPCRMLAPLLEDMAERYSSSVRVAKVNVDEQSTLALTYGVRTIPTVMVFRGGEPVHTQVGVGSKRVLKALFEQALTPDAEGG